MYGLRPLRLGEIFDAAIKITKAHPLRSFGLAITAFSALTVIQWFDLLSVDLSQSTTPTVWGLLFAGTGRESPLFWLAVIVAILIIKPFVYDVVHHVMIGTPLTPARVLIGGIPKLALSATLYGALTALALGLLVLPGLAVALLGSVSGPAIVNENHGPVAGLRRSAQLVRTNLARVTGFAACVWLFRILAGLVIALVLPGVLPYTLQPNSTRLLAMLLTVFIGGVVWPITLAARAILFSDLRIRAESLDVDLMIADITATSDPRHRWAPV